MIGNPKIPHINVHTESLLNKLITLKKETDSESSTSINDEIMDETNKSEEISSDQN